MCFGCEFGETKTSRRRHVKALEYITREIIYTKVFCILVRFGELIYILAIIFENYRLLFQAFKCETWQNSLDNVVNVVSVSFNPFDSCPAFRYVHVGSTFQPLKYF